MMGAIGQIYHKQAAILMILLYTIHMMTDMVQLIVQREEKMQLVKPQTLLKHGFLNIEKILIQLKVKK